MEKLMHDAVLAAIKASNEIMQIYQDTGQDFGIEKKADNSPLTLADKAAHNCIIRHLSQTGIPILSEEGAIPPYEQRKSWHRLWLIDPLDGTKEFIKKNGEFTVNIALVEDNKPLLGVILAPAIGIIYIGLVGFGAWKGEVAKPFLSGCPTNIVRLNGKDNERSQQLGEQFTIAVSRSHLTPETESYIKLMQQKYGDVRLISSGSSLKMCLVAEGVANVYPRFGPTMEWDTAAGDAIARAAGCQVVDAQNDLPLNYNKPDLHNPWFIVK